MLALRASLTNLPSTWYTSNDPCWDASSSSEAAPVPWTGVTCSDGAPQRVRALNLSCTPLCYTLGGTLPAELAGASALEIISLQSNRIIELMGWW